MGDRGKHRYRIDGQNFEVEVLARTATDAEVSVNGRRYRVERRDADGAAEPAATHAGPTGIRARRVAPPVAGELRAPMAGLVLRVNVTQGQTIAAGDPVLVLDAMKMENTIRAPHDGTVHEIVVVGGQSVLTGALLARIDEN